MLIQPQFDTIRSEEHTSELQSRLHLVCRLLLEKKKKLQKKKNKRKTKLKQIDTNKTPNVKTMNHSLEENHSLRKFLMQINDLNRLYREKWQKQSHKS